MTNAGLERVINDASDLADQRIRRMYDRLDEMGCESPIEKYFAIALWESTLIISSGKLGDYNLMWPKPPPKDFKIPHLRIAIWAQQKVFDWRADFVLGVVDADGRPHYAIVECDGHDFHERTKEQALRDRQRDRRAQQEGWRIFRLTGSELYARSGLIACDEILNGWACRVWESSKGGAE